MLICKAKYILPTMNVQNRYALVNVLLIV